jgi:hypothetical protein
LPDAEVVANVFLLVLSRPDFATESAKFVAVLAERSKPTRDRREAVERTRSGP